MNDYSIDKIAVPLYAGLVVDAIWKYLSSWHMAIPSHDEFIEIAAVFKE